MEHTKRAALYVRVSTVRQAEKDLSIPDQLRQLYAYCKLNGYEIAQEYKEEGASATDDNRPVFQNMVADIESGVIDVDTILVLTTSRFFRNAIDAGVWKRRLQRRGIRVIAIHQETGDPDTPTANLLDTIFAAIDEHESRMIGFHVGRGMRENARRGYFNGSNAPFGYKVVKSTDEKGNVKGVLDVDEEEAKIVKRIFEMHVVDGLGAVEVAKVLNDAGGSRRYKTGWSKNYVLRVLENPVCIGRYFFNQHDTHNKRMRPESEWIEIAVKPIIDKETFEAAATLRKTRTQVLNNGRGLSSEVLLTGLLKCGKCGSAMTLSTGKGGKYRYYGCSRTIREGVSACPGQRVRIAEFEQFVLNLVVDWAFSVDKIRDLVKEIRRSLAQGEKPIRKLRAKLDEVAAKLKKYYDTFENSNYEKELFADRIAELKAEKVALQLEIERRTMPTELPPHLSTEANIRKIQQALRDVFLTGTPGLVKRYLNILLKEIVVDGEEVTITAQTAGVMALLERGENKKSTPDITGVLTSSHKWRTRRDSNPQLLGP